nr:MAG TPA: hypothetical protein [Caudoviricetes sp.]
MACDKILFFILHKERTSQHPVYYFVRNDISIKPGPIRAGLFPIIYYLYLIVII